MQESVQEFLGKLDSQNIRYCAPHVTDGHMYEFDIFLDPNHRQLFQEELKRNGCVQHVLCKRDSGEMKIVFTCPDMSGAKRYFSLRVLSEHSAAFAIPDMQRWLLEERRRDGYLWIPALDAEVAYLLLEFLAGGLSELGHEHLLDLITQTGRDAAERISARVFGLKRGREIIRVVSKKPLAREFDSSTARTRVLLRYPVFSFQQWMVRSSQRWHSRLNPNGCFVVVLGPDGVGKSTVVAQLQRSLELVFGHCVTHRWRPGAIRRVAPGTSQRLPHSRTPRGKFTAACVAMGVFLDFCIGYWVYLRKAMVKSEAVIFDRYFHDMLVDPRRYRYSGSLALIRLLAKFVPPASPLFVVLDAEEAVVLRRKQELPLDELRRQRKAYRKFASEVPKSLIVNTESAVDETCEAIIQKIFECTEVRSREPGAVPETPSTQQKAISAEAATVSPTTNIATSTRNVT